MSDRATQCIERDIARQCEHWRENDGSARYRDGSGQYRFDSRPPTMRLQITVSVIGMTPARWPWTMPGRRERSARVQAPGNVSGLLAHSSSQSEDRDSIAAGKWRWRRRCQPGFLQAKAQDPSGLLACLEQLAAGGLAKMLEILWWRRMVARISSTARVRAASAPAAPSARQRAKKPGRIEGGVHRHVARLRHPTAPRQNNCEGMLTNPRDSRQPALRPVMYGDLCQRRSAEKRQRIPPIFDHSSLAFLGTVIIALAPTRFTAEQSFLEPSCGCPHGRRNALPLFRLPSPANKNEAVALAMRASAGPEA